MALPKWTLALSLSAIVVVGATPAGVDKRLIRVDDYTEHASERILVESIAFSPDGKSVAFVRRRSVQSLPPEQRSWFALDTVRDDVWLQEGPGRPVRNLTNGSSDASGAWEPRWSPSGAHLAFLSTRGHNIAVWVWDRSSRSVRQVSRQGLLPLRGESTCRWSDEEHLWCYVPAEGEVSRPKGYAGWIVEAAENAWRRAASGEPTASVVDSRTFAPREMRRLVSFDVQGGTMRLIATTGPSSIVSGPVWRSPDGRAVAVIGTDPTEYGPQILARMGMPRNIDLRWADGTPVPLKRRLPANVLTTTISWSPSGKDLAFFAYGDAPISPFLLYGPAAAEVMPNRNVPLSNPAKLWTVTPDTGSVQQMNTGTLNLGFLSAPMFEWTSAGELVFKVAPHGLTLNPVPWARSFGDQHLQWPTAPEHWVVLSREGRTRPLTTAMKAPPSSLISIQGGGALIGISEGDMWRIDPASGAVQNLTSSLGVQLTSIDRAANELVERSIVRLESYWSKGVAQRRLLVTGQDRRRYQYEIRENRILPIVPPKDGAQVVAIGSGNVAYLSDDGLGTFLWRSADAHPPELLAEANQFRLTLLAGQKQIIEYSTQNGPRERASLLLPTDYKPGRKYPLVVDVYPVRGEFNDAPNPSALLGGVHDFFAAAGYAVLKPSIPANLPDMRMEEGMSLFSLSPAILPAVDRAIAMGVADPDRLFVTGHSRGGWAVVGLLTQTTRFKAAMARAGCYKDVLLACAGSLQRGTTSMRFSEVPHAFAMPNAINRGYWPSDLPWWRDGERSKRNSPFSYVDRIKTPLLLVHGDLDPVDIVESEDLFLALTSMRKTARFVRYWGEMHTMANPANERDLYQRTFAWFDDYGDILRDAQGNMVWNGDKVKSRDGRVALQPEDFSRFGPAAPVGVSPQVSH